MSRLLYLKNDPRRVPRDAVWWRFWTKPNADGNLYVLHLDVGATLLDPWAGHIEYFDGRSDWGWPYQIVHRNAWSRSFIDILDIEPPSPPVEPAFGRIPKGGEWVELTENVKMFCSEPEHTFY